MKSRLPCGPNRLALRIYLVTVAAVLGPAIGVFVIVHLAWGTPREETFNGAAPYAAAKLALRWPSADGLRDEVGALRAQAGLMASVYRWDGSLVAAGGVAAPPLSIGERDELSRRGSLQRGARYFSRPEPSYALTLERGGAAVGYVVLEPTGPLHGPPRPSNLFPIAALLVALAIAAAVLGSAIARPLDRLAQTAHALGSGDLSARTGLSRRDELGAVASAFDDMADRVVALLRAQTELVANVAHELRTPLARIRVALELADGADAAVARESLAEIGADLGELERLVTDILASARLDLSRNTSGDGAPPLRLSRVAVGDVVRGAVQRLLQFHPGRSVEVDIEPELPAIEGDAVLLRRALGNLLDNARKYSAPDSQIRVRAFQNGDEVAVQVIDGGEGMTAADLARLFTPFFRADRSRARATGGVGLGLALTRRIVDAHGGSVVARSAPGAGTPMTLALPTAAAGTRNNR